MPGGGLLQTFQTPGFAILQGDTSVSVGAGGVLFPHCLPGHAILLCNAGPSNIAMGGLPFQTHRLPGHAILLWRGRRLHVRPGRALFQTCQTPGLTISPCWGEALPCLGRGSIIFRLARRQASHCRDGGRTPGLVITRGDTSVSLSSGAGGLLSWRRRPC